MTNKLILAAFAAAAVLATGAFAADNTPKSVIHVITVQWKKDATPAQIQEALKAAEALPSEYPGVKHVWTKVIKKQFPEDYNQMIVMEFASEDALQKYANSPAQKKWYELYMKVRGESYTSDVTN